MDRCPPLRCCCLHSIGPPARTRDSHAATLARRFRVIGPDLKGYAPTAAPRGPNTVAGLASVGLVLLNSLEVATIHLGGLAIGSPIGRSLAHQAPACVASLTCYDAAIAIPPAATWRDHAAIVRRRGMEALPDTVVLRWVTPGLIDTPAVHGLRTIFLRAWPEGYAATADAIAGTNLPAHTSGLTPPTLVLIGDQGEVTPWTTADMLAAAVPGADLDGVPGLRASAPSSSSRR
jgi:pimeloyl-ACP methyl ester carboxylesterase